MVDPVIDILLFTSVLLLVTVLSLRLRQVEDATQPTKADDEGRPAPAPPAMTSSLRAPRVAELCEDESRALFFSPLSVILAQCELARKDASRDERFQVIERQARRMRDLFERSRLPKRAINPAIDLDPATCVRAAVDHHAGFALERGVRVHVMTEAAPAVRANPELLRNALRHLVRASLEAAVPGQGDVTVAVGLLDDAVAFAVADDGPGLSPERLARILDPQTGLADGGAASASELSYAIVHAVAKAMGAHLVLDSAPGNGCRATLKLPVPVQIETPPTRTHPQAVPV